MPRSARLDFIGARHHIVNRGARRQAIFFGDDSRHAFLALLAEFPSRFGVSVHAYALLTNHYHLFVTSHRGNLAEAMRHLDGEYARALNAAYEWDGPLFKGRYHNRIVTDEAYVRHLIAYIHLNPLDAGMIQDVDLYDWSSHRAYVGADDIPAWLDARDLADCFGGSDLYREFVRDVHRKREAAPGNFDPADIWQLPAGTFGIRPSSDEAPEAALDHRRGNDGGDSNDAAQTQRLSPPSEEDPDLGAAIARVAMLTRVDARDLLHPAPGRRDQRARWLLVWWLTAGVGMRRVDVARRLRIGRSGVTQMLARFAGARVRGDVMLEHFIDELSSDVKIQ